MKSDCYRSLDVLEAHIILVLLLEQNPCDRVGFACFELEGVEPEALWDLAFSGFDEGDEFSG